MSLVILSKPILGIMSITSSPTREVSGRFVTEVTILPGPGEVRVDCYFGIGVVVVHGWVGLVGEGQEAACLRSQAGSGEFAAQYV